MSADKQDVSIAGRIVRSPLLWGGALTLGFYQILPTVPGFEASLDTLFCGHWLAYATTSLFWVGMAALGAKAIGLPRERTATEPGLRVESVPGSPAATAEQLSGTLDRLPENHSDTIAISRLRAIAAFVRGRKSTEGLDGHLSYLAEFAGEQLHNSYALVRTITWAVPILGFLGTVVGITTAIQNLDPAKLDTSFGQVSMGLGVAFGTTALALGLSLVLVFGTYLIEKLERSVLADVEMLALKTTTDLFPPEPTTGNPFIEAQGESARRLLEQSDALIARQVAMWEQSLETLRDRWNQTLQSQQTRLEESLSSAAEQTLTGQTESLRQQSQAQAHVARLLAEIGAGQDRLTAAQERVIERLKQVESNDALDETLHTLSAAIHMLTARVPKKAA
jgi:biopolymer transport protein ExbB/TolQ